VNDFDTKCLLALKPLLSASAEATSKERPMPRIIVMANTPGGGSERAVMFTERVTASDFESDHFQTQLVERLGWAVGDAQAVEQGRQPEPDYDEEPAPPSESPASEPAPRHQPVSRRQPARVG
jgi:hypothetical protein